MTKYKSILIEEVPTPNGRIYAKGSLQKIKDSMVSDILNKRCFAIFDNTDEDIINDTALKNRIVGIVTNFNIVDGQAVLDIEILPTEVGRKLKAIEEIYGEDMPFELKVNFQFLDKLSEKRNEYGFKYADITEIKPFVNIAKINGVVEE